MSSLLMQDESTRQLPDDAFAHVLNEIHLIEAASQDLF